MATWDVTNFAIKGDFLDRAAEAATTNELRRRLSNDQYYGLCVLYDEAKPFRDRPRMQVTEEVYREYGDCIREAVPLIRTALCVVRDILWLTDTRYCREYHRFTTTAENAPHALIAEQMFDHPDFVSFRYAYLILNRSLRRYAIGRATNEGELAYYIRFNIIENALFPLDGRSIRLLDYVEQPHQSAGYSRRVQGVICEECLPYGPQRREK